MGNDNNDTPATRDPGRAGKRSRILHWVKIIALVGVAVLPAIVAFVFVVFLPAERLIQHGAKKPRARVERPTTTVRADDSSALQREEQTPLLRLDEAFWNARLELVKQESISLAVDLVDSVASLDIRGVPVRNCRIHRIDISKAISLLQNRSEFRDRLSKPLVVRSDEATLPKEPIRVEEAPKDSIEAMKAAARPLAPEEADVFFTMYFDGRLALGVRQLEKPSSAGFRRSALLYLKRNLEQVKKTVLGLAHSELPQHELRIEVTLSREDAKAIYRALGPKARLALRL